MTTTIHDPKRSAAGTARVREMMSDDVFTSLTRNAFDFLERGIAEFDKSPKYSVIHFCAAVEMLLKARLMKEHWSLIVSRPEQANRTKFLAGDFASVTLEEARARIRDVAGEDIGDDATTPSARWRTIATRWFTSSTGDWIATKRPRSRSSPSIAARGFICTAC